ncbi:MAG: hypothetical protein V4576_03765 [Patescibacteria group bacterium]
MKLLTLLLFGVFCWAKCSSAQDITPEFIKTRPPLSPELTFELKKYEHFELAVGEVTEVKISSSNDIGYGITRDEVKDAIEQGFLKPGYKFPKRMTKAEADHWFKEITLPTYRAIVLETVKVPLTLEQETALTFFAQNRGSGSLKKLVTGKDRLNSGNYQSVVKLMPRYYNTNNKGLRLRCEFQIYVFLGEQITPKS